MEVAIRAAVPGDAAAIAAVHVAGWRWAYRGLIPDAFIDAITIEDRTRMWSEALAEPGVRRIFVAEGGDGVVGFASVGATEDPDATAGTGEVTAIYLLEHVAGIGVGRRLLAHAEAGLVDLGFGRGSLWVLRTNARARRFYEAAGWTWDGTTSAHRFDCAERPILRYVRDLASPPDPWPADR